MQNINFQNPLQIPSTAFSNMSEMHGNVGFVCTSGKNTLMLYVQTQYLPCK
jgi:hypothetical protein